MSAPAMTNEGHDAAEEDRDLSAARAQRLDELLTLADEVGEQSCRKA
jgi:hypothetical protein